jgi:phosphoribosylamine--glycine ligase
MKILVIGSGGREHALVWKLKQNPRVAKIYCAPGNAGVDKIAVRVPTPANDVESLVRFAKKEAVDLTIVGPEAPLVLGIVDRFRAEGLRAFGPDRFASQLEGSKVFAKELMRKLNVPTADFRVFDKSEDAKNYIAKKPLPIVVKVDGLAGGKGVAVVHTRPKAMEAVHLAMVRKVFGKAGERVLVEDHLEGTEASLIAVSDGRTIVPLASSQDHKRIFDGDQGPNTGGMGAYSPAPFVTPEVLREAEERVFRPVVEELARQGHPYVGFLYAGVMLTADGMKVLEFNVRFGDPEAQAILPRMESDFLDLVLAAADGKLAGFPVRWKDEDCVCVVLAAEGYPGEVKKGAKIAGLDIAAALPHVLLFHAGTESKEGAVVASGGRVLNVVATGRGLFQALSRTYEAVDKIYFAGMQYRKDIASRALTIGRR